MIDERPALFKAALDRSLAIEDAQRQWYGRPESEARAEAVRRAYRPNVIEHVGGVVFATSLERLDPETAGVVDQPGAWPKHRSSPI